MTGAATETHIYDGDGNRVKAMVNSTISIYVGNYYEVTGGVVKKYYYAGSVRVAENNGGVLHFLLTDHLGSTAVTTSDTGARVAELRYYPYGDTRYNSGSDTPPLPQKTTFRFTGQRWDPGSGLYFYNARWYDPLIGRFLSADTVVPQPGNPQALNRYSYVGNRPTKYTDPTGHCEVGENDECDPRLTARWWRFQHPTRVQAEAIELIRRASFWEEQPDWDSMAVVAHVLWNRAGHNAANVAGKVWEENQFQGFEQHHGLAPDEDYLKSADALSWERAESVAKLAILGNPMDPTEGDPTHGAIYFVNISAAAEPIYLNHQLLAAQQQSSTWLTPEAARAAIGYDWTRNETYGNLTVYHYGMWVSINSLTVAPQPFQTEQTWRAWRAGQR